MHKRFMCATNGQDSLLVTTNSYTDRINIRVTDSGYTGGSQVRAQMTLDVDDIVALRDTLNTHIEMRMLGPAQRMASEGDDMFVVISPRINGNQRSFFPNEDGAVQHAKDILGRQGEQMLVVKVAKVVEKAAPPVTVRAPLRKDVNA